MRRMQFLFIADRVRFQHKDHEETHPGEEHRLEIAVALRREEMHVRHSHLRRCHGLSLGPGRTLLL